ncbi:MAG: leucine-rich repeat domain-containing protein [Planctomycetaceae bacterium]
MIAGYPAIQAQRQRAAIKRIERVGGDFSRRARGPVWLREWTPIKLGSSPGDAVFFPDAEIANEDFARIVDDLNLVNEEITTLDLSRSDIGDEGVRELYRLEHLVYLDLSSTGVTDEGLASVAQIEGLQYLFLAETAVTDAGLAHLRPLRQLIVLNLDHTAVTDAGMDELSHLEQLAQLHVSNTGVTDTGLATLQATAPQVSVLDD